MLPAPALALPLAFAVASPLLLLGGLLLSSLPLLIHLLHRRRHRERPWAAMQFLHIALRRQARRMRMESLLLLTVRTLVIACAAFAVAQPFLDRAEPPGEQRGTLRVLVIDNSLSMSRVEQGESLVRAAQDMAEQLVRSAGPRDSFAVVRLCEQRTSAPFRPSDDRDRILGDLAAIRPTAHTADVIAALRPVLTALAVPTPASSPSQRPEVCILSDFQRANWLPDTPDRRDELRALLGGIAEQADLTLLPVTQAAPPNVAITHLGIATAEQSRSGQAVVEALVRSAAAATSSTVEVQLLVGDRVWATHTVLVEPRTETPVRFAPPLGRSAELTVEARIPSDSLEADNRRWLIIPPQRPRNVLVVNGTPRTAQQRGAGDFVQLALAAQAPRPSGRATAEPMLRPLQISDGELASIDLTRFDSLFLCDVALFSAGEAARLRAFAAAGGGVVIALGDNVRVPNYHETLGVAPDGLLPARLLEAVGDTQSLESAFHFDPRDYRHPIIRPFSGNDGAGLLTTEIYRYFRVELPPQSTAEIPLWYSSGDPALIEQRLGAGRILLVTTSLDDRWGNWALWPSFVPLVHEMFYSTIESDLGGRQLVVGAAIVRNLSPDELQARFAFVPPDAAPAPLTIRADGGQAYVTLGPLDVPGVYELRREGELPAVEHYAVNVETVESDLSLLDRVAFAERLLPDSDFRYLTGWRRPAPADASAAIRTSLSQWLFLAALGLLLVEQTLAWNFRMGLAALVGLAMITLAVQVSAGHLLAAALLGGFVAAALLGLAVRALWARAAKLRA